LGDICLQAADTLLLETRPAFVERHRHSRDFLLVSALENSAPVRHERAWLAWGILAGVVLSASLGWLSMLNAAMLGAAATLASGCCSVDAARKQIDTQVLLAIAAAFGLGTALQTTGAAATIARGFLSLAGSDPWLLLVCVYLITVLLTEIVTNNAAAVIMFPIVMSAAQGAQLNYMPFVIAVMMGASASFATPIGYQTNLMVYGLGGYRFSDYLRIGVPLTLLVGLVTLLIVPMIWPFRP
jgi:di/tricarboxylate transporter